MDGVIFLDQKRAIIDATAPHVVEPDAPGADELVVSLYHTIDALALLLGGLGQMLHQDVYKRQLDTLPQM